MSRLILKYLGQNQFIVAIIFVLALLLLYVLKETLIVIFISYIIVAAQLPLVGYLRKRGVPNPLAVVFVFSTMIILFGVLIAPLVPFFAAQITQLFKGFPIYINKAATGIGIPLEVRDVSQIISPRELGQNAFNIVGGVFGIFVTTIAAIAISFYLLLDYDRIKRHIANLFPKANHLEIIRLIDQVNEKLGAWLQGQIILCLVIGSLTWIFLTIISMPFALPLAVLAGLFEIVPSIGPIISAIPAVIIALTISPHLAIFVVGAYILIQMLENNLIVPRIMSSAVGLNPVVVILGVIIGNTLLGVAGALLSVPLISLLTVLVRDMQNHLEPESDK